jgi:hypothetical protein
MTMIETMEGILEVLSLVQQDRLPMGLGNRP